MKSAIPLTFCCLIIVCAGCGNIDAKATCGSLLSDLAHGEINTDLRVSAPSSLNTFKTGEFVNVVVDDNSKSLIEIALDQDVKVFWWNANAWSEEFNQVDYGSRVERISFPTGDNPGGTMLGAMPSISRGNVPIQTCIVLRGVKDPDGTRIKVGAYTELTMYPQAGEIIEYQFRD